jgi:hypothetical protein
VGKFTLVARIVSYSFSILTHIVEISSLWSPEPVLIKTLTLSPAPSPNLDSMREDDGIKQDAIDPLSKVV